MKWEFKENHTFGKSTSRQVPVIYYFPYRIYCVDVRCAESAKIRAKYQDRIPVRTLRESNTNVYNSV